jgi:hypothetical protein
VGAFASSWSYQRVLRKLAGPRRKGYLLPVRVLGRRFRTLFQNGFEAAWKRGDPSAVPIES